MAQLIVMPKLSDTMEEGVIANWLKKEGDKVAEGDLLAEIETDKATMEYESPAAGIILKQIAGPGKKVSLGQPICVIGAKGDDVEAAISKGGGAKPSAPAASAPAAKSSPAPAVSVSSAPSSNGSMDRVKASPLAKRMAQEKGVDLRSLQGSGPAGRIVVRDLDNAKGGGAGKVARMPMPTAGVSYSDQVIPNNMMRQTIAKRLTSAKNEAPHYYLGVSADMTAVNGWRARLNQETEKQKLDRPKVSVNDIVMMAVAKALRQHPHCNASWEGESIREFGGVHVAMAVALPTGLITPVVRNCDQLGIFHIAASTRSLGQRAKNGELQPQDYTGGTFTVSNLGMLGIEEFTAIINPPQAAILAVGATIQTPWVNDQGAVVAQPRMKMTMSCDHRVIDGATGAQFLQTLVAYLQDPLMMLA